MNRLSVVHEPAASGLPYSSPAARMLTETFDRGQAHGRALLGGCLPAGLPTPGSSLLPLYALAAACDFVEIALPTVMPYLDGPVIRDAHTAALREGFRLRDAVALVRDVAGTGTPVLVMGYWHTVAAGGPERLIEELAGAGAAGLVIPDLPAADGHRASRLIRSTGMHTILIASPEADREDDAAVAQLATGAVYLPVSNGPTGGAAPIRESLAETASRLRVRTGLPVAGGIGVSSAERARHVAAACDAVIVGSAFVSRAQLNPHRPAAAVAEFADELATAISETPLRSTEARA